MGLAQLIELAERAGEDELRSALISDLASVRFPEFVRHSWPVFHEESDEPLVWGWYIDCLGEHLEAAFHEEIVWLLISICPGFAKSLICSVMFPAWCWLHKPWWKFVCSGTNEPLTLRDARRHKQLIESPWFQRTFLPDWQISRTQAADTNFANTKHGVRLSRTVRSSITGQRPHCRVLDDANDPEKIDTEEFARVNHWIEHTLLKRRAKLTSPLISIQARVHDNDATGFMLAREKKPKLVHLVLPNRYEPNRVLTSFVNDRSTGKPWEDRRTKEDELLNPAILDQDTTDSERENDPAMDSAQNQQNPTPESGIIFRKDMFRYWSHEPTALIPANLDDIDLDKNPELTENLELEEPVYPTFPLPSEWEFIFFTNDFNNLKKEKATRGTDYAVIDVWGVSGGNIYLIFELRQKYGVSASARAVVDLVAVYENDLARILVESKANGPTVINTVRAMMGLASEADLPRALQFVRPHNVQGETKEQRAKGCVHVAEARRIFIQDPRENGEIIYWLNEVGGFPNRNRDDRVDTLTMALTYVDKHPMGD